MPATPAESEQTTPRAAARPGSRLGFGSARLDEYFGVWAIDPAQGEALAQRASRLNLRLHVEQQERAVEEAESAEPAPASRFGDGYGETLLEDGTAVIRVEGTLMKFASSMSRGTGTVQLRRMVRGARNDASVLRVMVVWIRPAARSPARRRWPALPAKGTSSSSRRRAVRL